jgi:hypothetical protein
MDPGRRQQMISFSLRDFEGKVRLRNRITYGDVQRLKRDVLPEGIESREDAELLLDLDRGIDRIDGSGRRGSSPCLLTSLSGASGRPASSLMILQNG